MAKDRDRASWDALRGRLVDAGAAPEDLDRFDAFAARRRFLGRMGKGSAAAALMGFGAGTEAVLQGLFGRGLIPAAWAQQAEKKEIPGKPGMNVYNVRPINGEFLAHELDDDVTPTQRHFIRNNGGVPERADKRDPQGWKLTIDGEVHNKLEITLADLKAMPAVTMPLLIECGGNGRSFFNPPVRGNQWKHGAIGCSTWTGVPLRDLLRRAGVKPSAVYTGHYGEDPPLSGTKEPISRGVPIDKAMDPNTLVAYQMNGEDLPTVHGWPVRLVVPGWMGSCSQKWLTRVWVRDQVHDGEKMGGSSYRVPAYPARPGEKVADKDMRIATSWIIKSMITRPAPDTTVKAGERIRVRGHAWAGDSRVAAVYVSTDHGITWQEAKLTEPANRYAWNTFDTEVRLPGRGYYEIWARAFDDKGGAQPFIQPWNPRGYLGNVVHRVPVNATA
jgi:DMSO/TMAO reductase YedYZ molybdopterin-dependent catalytic subunit